MQGRDAAESGICFRIRMRRQNPCLLRETEAGDSRNPEEITMKKNQYLYGVCTGIILAGSLVFGTLYSVGADPAGGNRTGLISAAGTSGAAGKGAENTAERIGTGAETETERESGLPVETEAEPAPLTLEEAGLRKGSYSLEGELKGGSGKAHFDGPLFLTVEEEGSFLTFTMSSPYYDYVIVEGERFEPLEPDGNSTFRVPFERLNEDFLFTADTTAMSEPHEIDYSVRIDLDALTFLKAEEESGLSQDQ